MAEATDYATATDETRGSPPGNTNTDAIVLVAEYTPASSINTSGHIYLSVEDAIGEGSTITAAVLHWYSVGYWADSQKPGTDEYWSIDIYDFDEIQYVTVTGAADAAPSNGWHEFTLTEGMRAYIMSGSFYAPGDEDTEFRFIVGTDPVDPRFLEWHVASYENTGGGQAGDWAAYLVVTYTEASTGFAHSVIVSC